MKLAEVHVELASLCNAGCSHCTWGDRSDKGQYMPTKHATSLIDEAVALGVRTMNFHGVGEPTLHPDLLRVLHHAEASGVDYWLSTNCTRLHLVADTMATLRNLTLVLAVPWAERSHLVVRAAEQAEAYLRLSPVNRRIFVQMVCSEEAAGWNEEMLRRFAPLVEAVPQAMLYFKRPLTWPDMKPVRSFTARGIVTGPKAIVEPGGEAISIGRGCTMPEWFLKINADGEAVPCCVGSGSWGIGRYPDSSLAALWGSPGMEEARRKWRAADDGVPCGHCIKRSDC